MNGDEAKRLFEDIRRRIKGAAELRDLIPLACDEQTWMAAGYDSWADCYRSEFAPIIAELESAGQKELIPALRESGLSLRQIGAPLGLDPKQVSRELDKQSRSTGVTTGSNNPRSGLGTPSENVTPPPEATGRNGPRMPDVPPSDADLLADTNLRERHTSCKD